MYIVKRGEIKMSESTIITIGVLLFNVAYLIFLLVFIRFLIIIFLSKKLLKKTK